MTDPTLPRTVSVAGQSINCATIDELREEICGMADTLDELVASLTSAVDVTDTQTRTLDFLLRGVEKLIAVHDEWISDWLSYTNAREDRTSVAALSAALTELSGAIRHTLHRPED